MNSNFKGNKAVANWIFIGVFMLLVQVILGGITRLTGSGLSITEWNVVTGALPPLNEAAWIQEFDKYKETPQYRFLNADFTLDDFKNIFFWEWFHRLWARLIGVVFLVGFIYLVAKKYLKQEMVNPLLFLFLFGAFQGAVGWIMVASGLVGDAVYVKPTKLAVHFMCAMGLIAYAYWFALKLSVPANFRFQVPKVKTYTWILIVLVGVQLVFGALMAGHKAATSAPTWPTINGDWVPDTIFSHGFWFSMIEDKITVHFMHRNLAYIILILIIIYTLKLRKLGRINPYFDKSRWIPMILVLLQVLLGIYTVLTSNTIVPNKWGNFEWLAQFHQIVGMLLLLSLVGILFVFRNTNKIVLKDN